MGWAVSRKKREKSESRRRCLLLKKFQDLCLLKEWKGNTKKSMKTTAIHF